MAFMAPCSAAAGRILPVFKTSIVAGILIIGSVNVNARITVSFIVII